MIILHGRVYWILGNGERRCSPVSVNSVPDETSQRIHGNQVLAQHTSYQPSLQPYANHHCDGPKEPTRGELDDK